VNLLAVVSILLQQGAVFYLVTHGVTLPRGGEEELQEVAQALCWACLGWVQAQVSWLGGGLALLAGLAAAVSTSRLRTLAVALLVAIVLGGVAPAPSHAGEVQFVQLLPTPPAPGEVPSRPSPRHVWVSGHWVWQGALAGYVWVPGRWVLPQARASALVEGPVPSRLYTSHRLIGR
jgi:hypothetical protein